MTDVAALSITPLWRSRSVARAFAELVDHAVEALRAQDINKVALVVIDGNIFGEDFWEHLGFTKRNDLVYRNNVITTLDVQPMNT